MSSTLHFRLATPEDAPEIQRLIQAAFRADDTRADWVGDTVLASKFHCSVEEVLAGINPDDRETLVAVDPSKSAAEGVPGGNATTASGDKQPPIVATVTMGKYPNHTARFSMVAVEQSSHRGGIGRLILSRAEEWCRDNWAISLYGLNALCTRKELVAWYERCGYRRTGETSPFPVDRIPGVELPEGLCFIELEKGVKSE